MKKCSMLNRIFGTAVLMLFATSVFASVAVSPTRLEIDANKVKNNYFTTAIEVKGDAQKPMRFRVYPEYFKLDENSEVVMLGKTNDTYDLSKKIRFVPSEFTIMQGKSQKLRINIANLNMLPDGESRAMLYIEDVNPKEFELDTGRVGIGAQLIVKTRIGVPIYVDKGKFVKALDIESLNTITEKNEQYSVMKLTSTGNSKVRYLGNAQILKDNRLVAEYPIKGSVVAGNNFYTAKDKIITDGVKESGRYTLRVVVSYLDEKGKRKNIKKETSVDIVNKI